MAIVLTGASALKKFQKEQCASDAWLKKLKEVLPAHWKLSVTSDLFKVTDNFGTVYSCTLWSIGAANHLLEIAEEATMNLEKKGTPAPGAPYTVLYGDNALAKLSYEGWAGQSKVKLLQELWQPSYDYKLTKYHFSLIKPSPIDGGDMTVYQVPKEPGFVNEMIEFLQNAKPETLKNSDFAEGPYYPLKGMSALAQPSVPEKNSAPVPVEAPAGPAMAALKGMKAMTTVAAQLTYPVLSEADMADLPTTSLASATGLYCPVAGTSNGTRYFLVADMGKLKLAARIQGEKLSFRFEGQGISAVAPLLAKLGIDGGSGPYRSVHLTLGSTGLPKVLDAKRAFSALLAGLEEYTLLSPPADLALIDGKGA
jgi:hypothetical protein